MESRRHGDAAYTGGAGLKDSKENWCPRRTSACLAGGGLAVVKPWPKESSLLAGHFRPQPAHPLACGSKRELHHYEKEKSLPVSSP